MLTPFAVMRHVVRSSGAHLDRGADMTTIVHEADATLDPLRGARTAVVGYGNQGRPWAPNLRDSGIDVTVCVRATRRAIGATADGFATTELDAASEFDVLCILVPDDVIPSLPINPRGRRLHDRRERLHPRLRPVDPPATSAWSHPACSAPRYGAALRRASASSPRSASTATSPAPRAPRTLAVAKAIGGFLQGAIELTPAGSGARPRGGAGALARARRA